jgi:hypothetical protein
MDFAMAVGADQHALVKFGFGFAVRVVVSKHLGESWILFGWVQVVKSQ